MTAPKGWKLVPLEPTKEMIRACKDALYEYAARTPEYRDRKNRVPGTVKVTVRYKAMLEAAPKSEQKFPWEI